ncbi:DNA cytosine methyltransferase [Sphingopyxis indica]|uniref:DNA (cytosine-5-)-methyltransferase n=1 Tax=Sphingopyxis indica TaxID=436663 RepID=A0A239KPI6_9SPHN|nr:DNA cytosine methyltransferase [Sphingopyxis indica]SNT19940.1 DNA (cytosine-5)-methyltransferase 1 [Sphingopyxis indica]
MKLPGLFIDGFAGGGGASTGIAQAIGRDPDIAVNHSSAAIAIHKANHPGTEHHCCDIRLPFLPRTATRGRKVWGVWFSPDCKEYSKAKGGPVKDRSIRALCWEVIEWVRETQPEVGFLENVEEFQYAAPLDGEGVPIADQKGREFKRFVRALRGLGFRVQWRILKACDYGAPTNRKRLYMIYRRDGLPIVWPKPTHAPANDNRVLRGEMLPYRTAAECIDWTIPCPSIFERDRELAEATKRRIAHGVMRYVVNAARPFIVPLTHQGSVRVHDLEDPFRTITGAHRGELALSDVELAPHLMTNRNAQKPFNGADEPTHTITAGGAHLNLVGATLVGVGGRRGQSAPMAVDGPYPTTTVKADTAIACCTMVKMGNGEREGQAPRALDVAKPYGTVTAKGSQAAAVTAFLSSFYGSDKTNGSGDPERPLRSARAGGQHHAVVAAHIEQANTGMVGHTPRKPLSTIVGKGCTQRIVETTMIERDALPPDLMERAVRVAAFLIKYYGNESDGHGLNQPIGTVTTKDRFAVVTVTIDAKTYVIVDIGLRMLKPRELARAQGFPDDYVLDPVVRKLVRGKWVEKPLTIAEQISAIGNSVCPPVARALVAANQPGIAEERLAA